MKQKRKLTSCDACGAVVFASRVKRGAKPLCDSCSVEAEHAIQRGDSAPTMIVPRAADMGDARPSVRANGGRRIRTKAED